MVWRKEIKEFYEWGEEELVLGAMALKFARCDISVTSEEGNGG